MRVDIIGGGIIGAATAFFLAKEGLSVRVLERDASYQQSSFNRSCGGCRHQFSTKENVLMSKYSIEFIKQVPDVGFVGNGYLMLFDHSMKDDFELSTQLQQENGATTKVLTPQQLKNMFSWINVDDVYRACYTNDGSEGWFDPFSLHTWYKTEAKRNGAEFVEADGICRLHESTNKADVVVIAAGCWSGNVGKQYGIDIPVKGHKHTVYTVKCPTHLPDMPLVADLITGAYWRPEGDGYIVGFAGNSEWDAVDLEANWNQWEETWTAMAHRAKMFEALRATSAWAGYYDTCLIDNNAIIDHVDNVYFATGFTGRGLMHSPAVGLTLMEMITKQSTTFDIDQYRLNRQPSIEKYVI